MSAAEVIEQIKRLPRSERQRVWEFMSKGQAESGSEGTQVRYAPDDAFEKVADKVFTEHDSLFRRLAQ